MSYYPFILYVLQNNLRNNQKYTSKELGSQPLPTTEDVEQAIPRPRSGTWGSKSDSKSKKEKKSKHESKADKKKKGESRSGSASRSNSAERRRGSVDSAEVSSPKKSGGMLDAFRSRSNSDAGKKKGSAFMASMRSAMLHTGLMHARPKAPRDGSAHPVRDGSSHTQYYHTVTAASSNRSPMTKVMDIFRTKTHNAPSALEDRRKKAHQLPGDMIFGNNVFDKLEGEPESTEELIAKCTRNGVQTNIKNA
ncbi:hypothetical protein WA026_000632 [Henosepilachna vigintioctopunctata]|uniref:Uncharacterized protein n=1 Tax=Henosepilachna vigintioctopunctata TaxID=420089 RepID=A0AAW1V6K9_9CUCU